MKLFKKEENNLQNIESVVEYVKVLEARIEKLENDLKEAKHNNRKAIKKVGITRYNPFPGVGGNQSFSLVLLDEDNNGAITTSLFSQDGNRVYGKSIKGGKSEHLLAEEEKKLLERLLETDGKSN